MTPETLFSLIALVEAAALLLMSITITSRRQGSAGTEHAKLFLVFSMIIMAWIILRRWTGIPMEWPLLAAVVVWEEVQKGVASRLSPLPAVSVCITFAAAELAVTKANLLLPSPNYLASVSADSLIYMALIILLGAGAHGLTGLVYQLLRSKPLIVPILLCLVIHFSFNALVR